MTKMDFMKALKSHYDVMNHICKVTDSPAVRVMAYQVYTASCVTAYLRYSLGDGYNMAMHLAYEDTSYMRYL